MCKSCEHRESERQPLSRTRTRVVCQPFRKIYTNAVYLG
nr:MAG TPA: hypothetical protein [Bacteriophage sp.]